LCLLIAASVSAATDEENGASKAGSDGADQSWKFRARLSKFEKQFSTRTDKEFGEWAGFVVVAKQRNTLWLTSKGSTEGSETDSAEVRLFYSRMFRPYLGAQFGWKRDFRPAPERDWLGFGLLFVLPYEIGADFSLFIGESGRRSSRLELAYQHWFTDKLSITPDLEANFYSEDDPDRGIGSGLSDLDVGLRLRYRIIKGVQPYTGITWKGNFGDTANNLQRSGEDTADLRVVVGVTLRI